MMRLSNSVRVIRSGFLATLASLLLAQIATAEQIKIPVGEQHKELSHVDKPRRGQSKAQVEKQHGEPVQRYAARGQPPISRWEYPGFIVYFEHGHVIHSVIKHRPNAN